MHVAISLGNATTNPDFSFLGSGTFQVRAAERIANAVDRFFESHGELWSAAAR